MLIGGQVVEAVRPAFRRKWSSRRTPVGARIRALVIQRSTAFRQTLEEAVGELSEPGVQLEFTEGLGEVAGRLTSGDFDVVVLDVERCLPAQLFWRLNRERWQLPVVVLQRAEIRADGETSLGSRAV